MRSQKPEAKILRNVSRMIDLALAEELLPVIDRNFLIGAHDSTSVSCNLRLPFDSSPIDRREHV